MGNYMLFNPKGETIYSGNTNGGKGKEIAYVGSEGEFALLDNNPFYKLNPLAQAIVDIPTWLAGRPYPDISEAAKSYVALSLNFGLTRGLEFDLDEEYLDKGFYGLAALKPILETLDSSVEILLSQINLPPPDFFMLGYEAEGNVKIDLAKQVAIIAKPFYYFVPFIYHNPLREPMPGISIYDFLNTKPVKRIVHFTVKEDPRLEVFKEFLKKLD